MSELFHNSRTILQMLRCEQTVNTASIHRTVIFLNPLTPPNTPPPVGPHPHPFGALQQYLLPLPKEVVLSPFFAVCLSACYDRTDLLNISVVFRAYFKRGVQPKCVVQTGKCGVQSLEMWSPNSQCFFCFWSAMRAHSDGRCMQVSNA